MSIVQKVLKLTINASAVTPLLIRMYNILYEKAHTFTTD